MTREEQDAFHIASVQKWLDGGMASWGTPAQSMQYLIDRIETLKIEVNQAAGTTVYEPRLRRREG